MPGLVAITGATGFIGRRLMRRFARDGWRVRVLVRQLPRDTGFFDSPAEVVPGSLDDAASLARLVEGADVVVHLAGVIKARSRDDFMRVNRDGVAAVLDATVRCSPMPQLVLVSSLAAREPHLSDYAASKRAGERVLIERGTELHWNIVRPPVVYGPGDRETLSLFKAVRYRIGLVPGGLEARISLIHVDDLADAIAVLPGSGDLRHQVIEPDDGKPGGHGWTEIIEAAAVCLACHAWLIPVPHILLFAAAHLTSTVAAVIGRVPMLTPGKVREILHDDWVCRGDALIRQTSWRPTRQIDQGFATTVLWYRNHGWL